MYTASAMPSRPPAIYIGIAMTVAQMAATGGPTTTDERLAVAGTSSKYSPAVTVSSTPSRIMVTCIGTAMTAEKTVVPHGLTTTDERLAVAGSSGRYSRVVKA